VTTRAGQGRARANLTVVAATVTYAALLLPPSPVAQAVAISGLLWTCGATATSFLDLDEASPALRACAVGALGTLTVLVVGAVLGSVLPPLGVARPLDRDPSLVCWGIVLVAAVARAVGGNLDPVAASLSGVRRSDAAWAAVLAVPPALALTGVAVLNAKADPTLAIGVDVMVVGMVLVAVALPLGRQVPRVLVLASAMLTATLQGTFRGGWLNGFDVQHEFYVGSLAIGQGRFPLAHYVDPYGGMLSLTVWPAELHSLTGMTLRAVLGLLPSTFLAASVVAVWAALRDRLGPRAAAALCSLFVLGSEPLVQELPQVTRQCYALFFFSLLVMSLAVTRLPRRTAQALACVGGVGLAITHYSSAYLAAGAVVVGCGLTYALRSPKALRVLSWPVTAVIAGSAALWGGAVARTGGSIGGVLTSVRVHGLDIFPGTGGLLTRWLRGASISQLVSARVIYRDDLSLRQTRYRWMTVTPRASTVRLVNDPAPSARGVHLVGPALAAGGTLIAECLLVASLVAVVWCLVRSRRQPAVTALAGAGAFFVLAAGLSRFSQTVGVDFGPSRVAAQAFLVFVVVVGVGLARVAERRPPAWARTASRWLGPLLAGLAVASSLGLTALIEPGAQLPATLSSTGEQAQRLLAPSDVAAAAWVAANRPDQYVVQADRIGSLALDDFGFNDRRNFF